MELSKLTEQLETQLEKERIETTKCVIEKLQECLGVNLYEAAKTDDPITTFNNMSFFLLDKFEDVFYYALESSNIDFKVFQREALVSIVLGVTRHKSNTEFLKELLMKRGIIKEYQEENGMISMMTILGPISFKRAEDIIDDETKEFVRTNIDIKSACHESALFLLKRNPKMSAVTAFARKNLNGKYLHSFIVDENSVLDLTGNLYMDKDDYYRLYGIEEIRNVNYEEFLKDSEKCQALDESGTMFPILRNAMYFYHSEHYIK